MKVVIVAVRLTRFLGKAVTAQAKIACNIFIQTCRVICAKQLRCSIRARHNIACSGWLGRVAIFRQFLPFGLFLLPSSLLAHPTTANANRWKATMQNEFVFRIKEIGVRKWHVVVASVEVPENWNELDEWNQREYITKPDGYSPNYHGMISWASSKFEKICHQHNIFGMVADFKYTPSNTACTRQGAAIKPSSNNLGFAPCGVKQTVLPPLGKIRSFNARR